MIAHAGEMGIKSRTTRRYMVKLLHNIIAKKLNRHIKSIKNVASRSILVNTLNAEQEAKLISRTIFGVNSTSPIHLFKWDTYENLIKEALIYSITLLKPKDTFGIDARSSGKNRPSTTQIKIDLGSKLLEEFENSISVNLDSSKSIIINVEVRDDLAWVYHNKYEGLGGFPLGSQRNFVFGLLRPWYLDYLASFLIMRRGVIVHPLRILTDVDTTNNLDPLNEYFKENFFKNEYIDIPIYELLQKWKPMFKNKLCTACTLFSELLIAPQLSEGKAAGLTSGLRISQEEQDIDISTLAWLDTQNSGISFRPCLIKNIKQESKMHFPEIKKKPACCSLVSKKHIIGNLEGNGFDIVNKEVIKFQDKYLQNLI